MPHVVYDQTSNYHTMALRENHQEKASLVPSCDRIRANTQFSTYDNQVNNIEVNNIHVVGGSSIQPNTQTAQSVMSGTVSCWDMIFLWEIDKLLSEK